MLNQSSVRLLLLMLATLAAVATAGAQQPPPSTTAPQPSSPTTAQPPQPAPPAGTVVPGTTPPSQPATSPLAAADAEKYIIGPSDVIQVFVWRNQELTTTVPVRPDGKITTPLVDDMIAVGKTPTQLARDVEARLSEYIRSPQVSIIVTQPASLFSQVKIVGQVRDPKPLAYRQGMTLIDALLAVGGLSEYAAGNRAKIVREENGKTREIRVEADDLMNKGDMSQNRELKPGDVIVIPESRW
jgi:polysaccharide export outer membrane protein